VLTGADEASNNHAIFRIAHGRNGRETDMPTGSLFGRKMGVKRCRFPEAEGQAAEALVHRSIARHVSLHGSFSTSAQAPVPDMSIALRV
jgi:hypothetical protein